MKSPSKLCLGLNTSVKKLGINPKNLTRIFIEKVLVVKKIKAFFLQRKVNLLKLSNTQIYLFFTETQRKTFSLHSNVEQKWFHTNLSTKLIFT